MPSDVPAMITNEMYNNEINYYPLPYGDANPDMSEFEMWGHYSQIMWASTTSVGCATQYCPGGLANTGSDVSPYFTVCNYSPPGQCISVFVSLASVMLMLLQATMEASTTMFPPLVRMPLLLYEDEMARKETGTGGGGHGPHRSHVV